MSLDAVKIGMLHRREVIQVVAGLLKKYSIRNVVLDPVMITKSRNRLLAPEAISFMKRDLSHL